jgi:hypothetical protein
MPAYWAVLRSAPGHDVLAYEGVVRAGFEILAPKIRTRTGMRWRTSPLFGCYFFVRVIDQWRVLERTVGVLSVVKAAGVPARCPDEEIATLIARSDPDGVIRLSSAPASSAPRGLPSPQEARCRPGPDRLPARPCRSPMPSPRSSEPRRRLLTVRPNPPGGRLKAQAPSTARSGPMSRPTPGPLDQRQALHRR